MDKKYTIFGLAGSEQIGFLIFRLEATFSLCIKTQLDCVELNFFVTRWWLLYVAPVSWKANRFVELNLWQYGPGCKLTDFHVCKLFILQRDGFLCLDCDAKELMFIKVTELRAPHLQITLNISEVGSFLQRNIIRVTCFPVRIWPIWTKLVLELAAKLWNMVW